MRKEKPEKMPEPGRKLSEKAANKIVEDFKIEYSEEDRKAGRDLEYFVVVTKDRGAKLKEKQKDVSHYIPKWEKIPDRELDPIPKVEEVIEALKNHYSKIDPEEKYPTREAVKKLRQKNKHE